MCNSVTNVKLKQYLNKVTIHYLVASPLLVISFAVCLYRVSIFSIHLDTC